MPSSEDGRPHRLRARVVAGVPLGAVFIGSTLVGLPGPASADTAPIVTLVPDDVVVEDGESASLTVQVDGVTPEDTCLYSVAADNGFDVGELDSTTAPANAEATGTPDDTVNVTATVTYAGLGGSSDCADVPEDEWSTVTSVPLPVTVLPSEDDEGGSPPEDDDEGGSPPEDDDEDSGEGDSGNDDENSDEDNSGNDDGGDKGSEAPPAGDDESATQTDGSADDSGSGPGSNEGSSGGGHPDRAAPSGADPAPPELPGPDTPGDDADRPSPPDGSADLPEVDPGEEDELADLPTVEPSEEGNETSTAASGQEGPRNPVVTAVMLAAVLVLLLLLAAPLGPVRRVRAGAAYIGQRRRH